jgi:hypothetical protein
MERIDQSSLRPSLKLPRDRYVSVGIRTPAACIESGYYITELSRQLLSACREPLQNLILINKIIFCCVRNSAN